MQLVLGTILIRIIPIDEEEKVPNLRTLPLFLLIHCFLLSKQRIRLRAEPNRKFWLLVARHDR